MGSRNPHSPQRETPLSRRRFLAWAGVAGGWMIVPRHVLGGPGETPPSEKLNIAGIGIGGMGKIYLQNVSSENIAALCDVDEALAAPVFEAYPKASRYSDYRTLLDKEDKNLDAVVIGTPDHTHAVVAMDAMRRGKHLYCAKPLTRTILEARTLTETARKMKVATQMSTQSNASEDHRLLAEWIWDGAIGAVHEVQIWSNRPIWPQGLDRPKETPATPETLKWDLFLGPAPLRPYHPIYHPFKWRGWWDFGTGALGDMGCHAFDPVMRALKLGYPTSVEASSTKVFEETAPAGSIVRYDFPARAGMPAVTVSWYDGGLRPKRPQALEPGRRMGHDDQGILFLGDKGTIMTDGVGRSPRLIPEKAMLDYKRPGKSLPRSPGHYQEWIRACKGGEPAGMNFERGGPLTEIVLLGNAAIRAGQKLQFDAKTMRFPNAPEANRWIHAPYRDGWKL